MGRAWHAIGATSAIATSASGPLWAGHAGTAGRIPATRCSKSAMSAADCMLPGRSGGRTNWDPRIQAYDPYGPGEDPIIESMADRILKRYTRAGGDRDGRLLA